MIKDFSPFTFRTALFYYDIHDFINDNGIIAPAAGLGTNAIYNIPHVKLYGVEFEASIKLNKFWATVSYMYEDHEINKTKFEKEWTYYLVELLPYHRAKFAGAYQILKNGQLRFTVKYVGDRKAQKSVSGERIKLTDYIVTDAEYEHTLKVNNMNLSLGIFVNNLTRTTYQELSGYKMPKQIVGINLRIKF